MPQLAETLVDDFHLALLVRDESLGLVYLCHGRRRLSRRRHLAEQVLALVARLTMLSQTILDVPQSLLLDFDLCARFRERRLGALSVLLECRESRRERVEPILNSVDPQVVFLHFEQRG